MFLSLSNYVFWSYGLQVYWMSEEKRGRALVINISTFYKRRAPCYHREGSDIDCTNVSTLFKDMQFDVNIHQNLTAKVGTLHVQIACKK